MGGTWRRPGPNRRGFFGCDGTSDVSISSPGRTNTGSESMLAGGALGQVCARQSCSLVVQDRCAQRRRLEKADGGAPIGRELERRRGCVQGSSPRCSNFFGRTQNPPLLDEAHHRLSSKDSSDSRSTVQVEFLTNCHNHSPDDVFVQTSHRMSESRGAKPGPEPADRVVIGITFGNSNSSIAYTVDDKAEVIANEDGGA